MNIETNWMENPKYKQRKPMVGDIIIDTKNSEELTVVNYLISDGSILINCDDGTEYTRQIPLDYFYEELGPYEDQSFEFKVN